MSNVVIPSEDPLSQGLAKFLIENKGFYNIYSISELKDGDHLYIIAHDNELGDGSDFIKNISSYNLPDTDYKIILIVCSAATIEFSKDLISPAERIANALNKSVFASTTAVKAEWGNQLSVIGNYMEIQPGSDIVSLFEKLSIED